MYHSNAELTKKYIINRLEKWGIDVDAKNGQISAYTNRKENMLHCRSLYLLRHTETIGTREKRFMSDLSNNAVLTEQGITDVKLIANKIEKMKFDCIIYSSINRVKQTAEIVRKSENYCDCYIEIPWMKGIDNAGWEGKNAMELKGQDREDFYQREILHNIFAKSSKGCSWGEVLVRCIDLVEFLNMHYRDRKILLISQGSIFIGLKMILQLEDKLWENYDPESFFGLIDDKTKNYGKLQYIYGENIVI